MTMANGHRRVDKTGVDGTSDEESNKSSVVSLIIEILLE